MIYLTGTANINKLTELVTVTATVCLFVHFSKKERIDLRTYFMSVHAVLVRKL